MCIIGKKSKRQRNRSPLCYHGCTKKEFNCGAHHKILEGCDKYNNKDFEEFINSNILCMFDPTIGNFVIAHIADDYLKRNNNDILVHRLLLLLHIRYYYIPQDEGKDVGPDSESLTYFNKYGRDIATKRGIINCMAREIPCNCMEEKRIAAKLMEQVAVCFGCGNKFPKKQMLRCKGCDIAQYCSKECCIKDWAEHKKTCQIYGSLLAPTSASVPSSFGEPSEKIESL